MSARTAGIKRDRAGREDRTDKRMQSVSGLCASRLSNTVLEGPNPQSRLGGKGNKHVSGEDAGSAREESNKFSMSFSPRTTDIDPWHGMHDTDASWKLEAGRWKPACPKQRHDQAPRHSTVYIYIIATGSLFLLLYYVLLGAYITYVYLHTSIAQASGLYLCSGA